METKIVPVLLIFLTSNGKYGAQPQYGRYDVLIPPKRNDGNDGNARPAPQKRR
jgi:hypothetical protein